MGSVFRRGGLLLVATTLLQGCGASQAPIGIPSATQQTGTRAAHASPSTSWMAAEASSKNLLYVSDGDSNVDVYSYPEAKVEGTLTSFVSPRGLCVDKAGNVFVANSGEYNILEYAHGGKTPIKTISDTGYFPNGCSVDPTTGNLAVSNVCEASGNDCIGPGNLALYKKAKGTPTYFADGSIARMFHCDYDNSGNIFVDGQTGDLTGFQLAELKNGKSAFINIRVNHMIYWPGGVQWDGKYVAVGDEDAGGNKFTSVIYRVQVKGPKGTVVSTMRLQGSGEVLQFWIQGSKLIGPDPRTPTTLSDIRIWNYPAGGPPTKIITAGMNGKLPSGATVSLSR